MATVLNNITAAGARAYIPSGEDEVAVLMLNYNGMIRDCNNACRTLLGCVSSRLIWRHVSMLLPQLTEVALTVGGHINPRLRFLSRIGHLFEVVSPGGERFFSRLFFNEVGGPGRQNLRVIISPVSMDTVEARTHVSCLETKSGE